MEKELKDRLDSIDKDIQLLRKAIADLNFNQANNFSKLHDALFEKIDAAVKEIKDVAH